MRKKCFVIMPFGNSSEDSDRARQLELIYTQWIKHTVENLAIEEFDGLRIDCHRADKTNQPGEIITHIIEQLVSADVVIADLSGRNANVFYELGVRHAVQNNTILIAQDISDIPFDLRPLRTIEYKYSVDAMPIFRDRLSDALRAVIASKDKIDNPVRRYLYEKAVGDLVKESVPPGFDAIRSMATEIFAMRKDLAEYAEQMKRMMEVVASSTHTVRENLASNDGVAQNLEGLWEGENRSTYCARVVDGHLYVPYCFAGSDHLTGHYFDCTLVGQTYVGRFEWFKANISGYVYFRLEAPNRVEGGWWYGSSIPRELRNELGRLLQVNDSIPNMHPNTWKRKSVSAVFPEWAEDYFRRRLFERKRKK